MSSWSFFLKKNIIFTLVRLHPQQPRAHCSRLVMANLASGYRARLLWAARPLSIHHLFQLQRSVMFGSKIQDVLYPSCTLFKLNHRQMIFKSSVTNQQESHWTTKHLHRNTFPSQITSRKAISRCKNSIHILKDSDVYSCFIHAFNTPAVI